ncbi:MAG: hypothetical protein ACO1RX_15630 [Candidatus Sericytochromatia bacterium]
MAITRRSFTSISSLCLILLTALSACGGGPGGTPVPPVAGLVRKTFSPTWGPDGQRIAFLYRFRPEGSQEVRDSLYTVLLNGTDLVKVRSLSPARFKSVSWSPNGAYFLLSAEETEEIYVTESNGQNLEKLTEGDQPSWHPSELKFVSSYDNDCQTVDRVGGRQCQRQIRLFDLLSRTSVALPVTLENPVIAPNWSNDGLKIQWLSTSMEQTKEQARRLLEFHSYNIATEDYQVTEIEPTELVFSGAEWSRDSSLLAFAYLSKINLYFFNQRESFSITEGIEPTMSVDNTRVLYTNLIGENRGDIALFDRTDQSISTVISHRLLPEE